MGKYILPATGVTNVPFGAVSWNTGSGAPYPLNGALAVGEFADKFRYTSFGAAIPAAAKIIGIGVSFNIQNYLPGGGSTPQITDYVVELVKNGVPSASNLANGQSTTLVTTSYATWSYGGVGQLWGYGSLTSADTNIAGWGFQLTPQNTGLGTFRARLENLATMTIFTAGSTGSAFISPFISFEGTFGKQEEEDDMYVLDDVVTFYAQASQYTTGAAFDATGSPAYRVYEESTGTPILTGSLALLDSSNTDGFYSASVTASAANGFEVGKTYCIRVSATVDSVAQAGIVKTFKVNPTPLTTAGIATAVAAAILATPSNLLETNVTGQVEASNLTSVVSDVWGQALPALTPGRPTDVLEALTLLTKCFINKNVISPTMQTLYNDDDAEELLTGAVTLNGMATARQKMS